MDYRLLFTQRALNDLAEIIGHIAEDDGEAAIRFGSALLDHVDLLSRFPRMGGASENGPAYESCSIAPFLFTTESVKTNTSSRCFTSVTDRGNRRNSDDYALSGSGRFSVGNPLIAFPG